MQVSAIQQRHFTNYSNLQTSAPKAPEATAAQEVVSQPSAKIPAGFRYGANIHFGGGFFDPNRTVPDIGHEEYMAMSENTKKRYRKICAKFDKTMDKSEMFDAKTAYLPLGNKHTMDEFIKTSRLYLNYKDQPIVCLGRSPKWFLNAAQWMKDGIPPYKFVAFSKYWYRPDPIDGMRKINSMTPTDKEIKAYRKYLDRIKADPQTIVDNFKKTGKRTVITDYISTGKGVTSFLDVMSNYADEKGILEEFSKAIQIVGIGSMDYLETFYHDDEDISEPRVLMPEKLQKYRKNIKQEFYNMDYDMFGEMLLNQNTNECRSTYYPHDAWTVYKPDKFKTGLIKDMKKVKQLVKDLNGNRKMVESFTPAMGDFRNLLNFRILDGLNERNLLKIVHKTKI